MTITEHVPIQKPRGMEEPPTKELLRPRIGVGLYLPDRKLTTKEIGNWKIKNKKGRILTEQEILDRTGVVNRSIAGNDEDVVDMGIKAARMAVGEDNDVKHIFASASLPTSVHVATGIREGLGIRSDAGVKVKDFHAACAGSARIFTYIHEHQEELWGERVVVVASEKFSDNLVDLRHPDVMDLDPSLGQTIMGDGAAAVSFVVGEDLEFLSAINTTVLGDREDLIQMGMGHNVFVGPSVTEQVVCSPTEHPDFPNGYFTQGGYEVYRLVLRGIPGVILDALNEAELTPEQIAQVIFHPGSKKVADDLENKLMKMGFKGAYTEYDEGNMSSVSMLRSFIGALGDDQNEAIIHKGDHLALAGFGAGLPLFASVAVLKVK